MKCSACVVHRSKLPALLATSYSVYSTALTACTGHALPAWPAQTDVITTVRVGIVDSARSTPLLKSVANCIMIKLLLVVVGLRGAGLIDVRNWNKCCYDTGSNKLTAAYTILVLLR